MQQLDDLDRRILRALQDDATITAARSGRAGQLCRRILLA